MRYFEQDLQKYQRQLDMGFRELRFEKPLEQEFLDRFYARNLIKQRTALFVAILLMFILAPLDYMEVKQSNATSLYTFFRIWISCPLLALAYLLTFTDFFKRHQQNFALVILITVGISMNIVSVLGTHYGLRSIYEGSILIIFGGYLLSGLRFRYTLSSSLIIGFSHVAFSLGYSSSGSYDLHSYFFIFGALVIGGSSAYALEYQSRLGFLQRGALRNSAKIDPLTGLLNRGAINQSLETIMEYAKREKRHLTLLMVDVDYFKKFNDFYGHLEGDNALIAVANSLAQCCRRSLDFAGRYGGEEFILVWFDTKPDESEGLSNLVQEKIAALKIDHQQSKVGRYLTLSGGLITIIPSESTDVQTLINKADELLYQSKDLGRNRISIYRSPSDPQPQ
ncbi:MAG: GGDEF domain-containing protein [Pseudomonadales bacterium]|nr:GGDEF domain-containing protein [Pseudomonadales bacterium]